MSLDDEILRKKQQLQQQMRDEERRQRMEVALKKAYEDNGFYDTAPILISPWYELSTILNETMPRMKFTEPKIVRKMPDGRVMVRRTKAVSESKKKERADEHSFDIILKETGSDKNINTFSLWVFPNGNVVLSLNNINLSQNSLSRENITNYVIRDKIIEAIAAQSLSKAKTQSNNNSSGGCYIASAVYGSYNCPEVWVLRRYRDRALLTNPFGKLLVKVYYALSPSVVKIFGSKKWFGIVWRKFLDRKVEALRKAGYSDSEYHDENIY